MRHWTLVGGLFLLTVAVGCNRSNPGGDTTQSKSQFTMRGPTMATSIAPDDPETVKITVNRGNEFKENIKLTAQAPKHIAADLSATNLTPSDKGEFEIKLVAHDEAAVGEHVVKITATPSTGAATTLDVKVKVNRAENSKTTAFTLKGPLFATTIKQGDTETVDVSVTRDEKYSHKVQLKAEAPAGLKVEFTPANVTPAYRENVKLRITAEPKAALGEHTIRITGAPESGQPVATELKVTVREP
jgi:uncharacterized membrane protein